MTNYLQNAIANLEKQAVKLQDRAHFYQEKEDQARVQRIQQEEQYQFILKQIASLKGEAIVNGEVK